MLEVPGPNLLKEWETSKPAATAASEKASHDSILRGGKIATHTPKNRSTYQEPKQNEPEQEECGQWPKAEHIARRTGQK